MRIAVQNLLEVGDCLFSFFSSNEAVHRRHQNFERPIAVPLADRQLRQTARVIRVIGLELGETSEQGFGLGGPTRAHIGFAEAREQLDISRVLLPHLLEQLNGLVVMPLKDGRLSQLGPQQSTGVVDAEALFHDLDRLRHQPLVDELIGDAHVLGDRLLDLAFPLQKLGELVADFQVGRIDLGELLEDFGSLPFVAALRV